MPQVPTYIRQQDWDSYIAIQSSGKWPEFVHNALAGQKQTVVKQPVSFEPVIEQIDGDHIKPEQKAAIAHNNEVMDRFLKSKTPDMLDQENRYGEEAILESELSPSTAGEKKCCASTKKKCEHWQWDENEMKLINIYSGRTKEFEFPG